jgi:hypothetical protein
MKASSSLNHTRPPAGVISGLVLLAAISFCERRVTAQVPTGETQKANPNKTVSQEDIDKLPKPRDPSKLNTPKSLPPPRTPTVLPEAATGFSASVKTPNGLHTIVFTTPGKDTLEVYLPNRLSAGSGFTATMKLLPRAGATIDTLKNYSIQIGGQRLQLSDGKFDIRLPGQTNETTSLRLVDKNGNQLAGVELPVFHGITPPLSTSVPGSGTFGNLVEITCPCAGNLGMNDYLKIGGEEMPLLASSPGSIVALNKYTTPGMTQVEVNTGGVVTTREFRNLTLKVTADKLQLLKGETTIVHIVVAGLENLKAPAKMTIKASGVVTMGGGNLQTIAIDPAAVKADGTYTTAQTLVADSAGTFGVDVTVVVDEKK